MTNDPEVHAARVARNLARGKVCAEAWETARALLASGTVASDVFRLPPRDPDPALTGPDAEHFLREDLVRYVCFAMFEAGQLAALAALEERLQKERDFFAKESDNPALHPETCMRYDVRARTTDVALGHVAAVRSAAKDTP